MAADARSKRRARRRGLTLLELILALGLATFVVYAIGLAIHLHLRSLDMTRTQVEESQLARAVLQMMSDDLRGALQQRKQDFSGVEAVLANSLQAAAAAAAAAAAEAGEETGDGGDQGGQSSGGTQGQASGGSGGGSQGGGGTGSGGGGSGGSGSGGSGGSSGGGSSGGDLTGDEMGLGEEEPLEQPDYSLNIASGEMIPPVVGIYGNAFELQIDVSRVPRIDEYRTMAAGASAAAGLPPSDIKTIAYYVTGAGGGGMLMQGTADPFGATSGLVRRETSRSQATYSYSMGAGTVDASREVIVAPEVSAVQFLYFDGFQWQTEWDSTVMGGLPFAVSIEIAVTTNDYTPEEDLQSGLSQPEVIPYRLVVPIPTAEPIPPEAVDENLEELGLMP